MRAGLLDGLRLFDWLWKGSCTGLEVVQVRPQAPAQLQVLADQLVLNSSASSAITDQNTCQLCTVCRLPLGRQNGLSPLQYACGPFDNNVTQAIVYFDEIETS